MSATADLTIGQGETWSQVLVYKTGSPATAVNLTGYTARMQARSAYSSHTVVVELTTTNGRIALGTTNGQITLSLSATETAALAAGRYVYDLELVSAGGVVKRLVEGTLTITPEVTR